MEFPAGFLHLATFLASLVNEPSGLGHQKRLLYPDLKYGQACSWQEEMTRQEIARLALPGSRGRLAKNAGDFLGQICSNRDMLVCDRISRTCICGDSSYESIIGVDRSLYILEDGVCRLKNNSYCIPDDMQKEKGIRWECQLDTSCQTRDGQICSEEALFKGSKSIVDNGNVTQASQLMAKLFSGAICSCRNGYPRRISDWSWCVLIGFAAVLAFTCMLQVCWILRKVRKPLLFVNSIKV